MAEVCLRGSLGLTARKSPCVQGPSSLVGTEPGCANQDADGALALPGPLRLSWSFLDLTSTVEGLLCFVLRCCSSWYLFSALEETELKANGEMGLQPQEARCRQAATLTCVGLQGKCAPVMGLCSSLPFIIFNSVAQRP